MNAERFWAKVDKSGDCWVWTGSRFSNGYGYVGVIRNGVKGSALAHRVAFELAYGTVPAGLMVCHRCDNRSCVRPLHLFLGTAKANAEDMVAKERHARGSQRPSARLNEKIVAEMRRRYREGAVSIEALAAEHGVCMYTVQAAVRGIRWKHVAEPPVPKATPEAVA